jgi:hypothetical protein
VHGLLLETRCCRVFAGHLRLSCSAGVPARGMDGL